MPARQHAVRLNAVQSPLSTGPETVQITLDRVRHCSLLSSTTSSTLPARPFSHSLSSMPEFLSGLQILKGKREEGWVPYDNLPQPPSGNKLNASLRFPLMIEWQEIRARCLRLRKRCRWWNQGPERNWDPGDSSRPGAAKEREVHEKRKILPCRRQEKRGWTENAVSKSRRGCSRGFKDVS